MHPGTPGSPFGPAAPDAPREARILGVLGGAYRILELKRGGMSDVYICESLNDPELKVAFKTFRKDLAFDRLTRLSFLREVAIWMRISGLPHIMPTLGLHVFDGRPYIRMPAALGIATLRDGLTIYPRLPNDMAHPIAFQLAYGMLAAQRRLPGLVHGDLKPENLFFREDRTVLISDFGMSRVHGETDVSGLLDSSWPYQAPECWSTGAERTPLSDVYAFGVILYEIVTGALPIQARGREEWARAHREQVPGVPQPAGADERLLGLARHCLEKDPRARPATFVEVVHELDALAGFDSAVQMHMHSNDLFHEYDKFQKAVRPLLIRALVAVGELSLAMTELDDVPDASRDAPYWALRGSALSLANRDEEALEALDRALKDESGEARYQWESERALSLKRLGRSDEAIAVYHRLLLEVPDPALPMVIGNLATVYLDRREPNPVIRLLRPLTQGYPKLAAAWGNLGTAYAILNQFDKAEEYLRRAMAADPQEERLRANLAVDVLLKGLGRVDEALPLLESGFNQGDQSVGLFSGLLACYQLLGKQDELRSLAASLTTHFPPETTDRLLEDTHALAAAIVEISRRGSKPPIAADISVPGEEANAALQQAWDVLRGIVRSNGTAPNATVRLEASAFSFNFYDDLAAPDFVATFMRVWRAITRTLRYRLPSRMPRSNPFYFTHCPHCRTLILTNRDHHEDLQCQVCQQHHATAPFESAVTNALLPGIHEALGKHLVDLGGRTVVLVVQPRDEAQKRAIDEICRTFGFTPMRRDSLAVRDVIASGFETGLFRLDHAFSVWGKPCASPSLAYHEDTPPEIERLVLHLRDEVGDFVSLSTFDQPDVRSLYEEAYRNALRDDPQSAIDHFGLIEMLLMQNRFDDALPHALAGVRSWPDDARVWSNLARVEQGREQYGSAIDHAKHALRLDPTDRRALIVLVAAHRARGDEAAANAAYLRFMNLGLGL